MAEYLDALDLGSNLSSPGFSNVKDDNLDQDLEEFINMLDYLPEPDNFAIIPDNPKRLMPDTRKIVMSDVKMLCICCHRVDYIINKDIYYNMIIPDKNIKLCLSCAQIIYTDKISRSKNNSSMRLFTCRRVIIYSYSGTSINTSLKEQVCIMPAIINNKIRYICLYASLVKALVYQEYDTKKCMHCNTISKYKTTYIYDTSYYVCNTCYILCREVKLKDDSFDIFVDYHRPDMRCHYHKHTKTWIYVRVIIKSNYVVIIPICYSCYMLLDVAPVSIFL